MLKLRIRALIACVFAALFLACAGTQAQEIEMSRLASAELAKALAEKTVSFNAKFAHAGGGAAFEAAEDYADSHTRITLTNDDGSVSLENVFVPAGSSVLAELKPGDSLKVVGLAKDDGEGNSYLLVNEIEKQ